MGQGYCFSRGTGGVEDGMTENNRSEYLTRPENIFTKYKRTSKPSEVTKSNMKTKILQGLIVSCTTPITKGKKWWRSKATTTYTMVAQLVAFPRHIREERSEPTYWTNPMAEKTQNRNAHVCHQQCWIHYRLPYWMQTDLFFLEYFGVIRWCGT